jgi:hypothetical protein
MTIAFFLIGGTAANAMINYKGLRIKPSHKHDVIPMWENGERFLVAEYVGKNPRTAFHARELKSIQYEGLGVDHEEWKKRKEDYGQVKDYIPPNLPAPPP